MHIVRDRLEIGLGGRARGRNDSDNETEWQFTERLSGCNRPFSASWPPLGGGGPSSRPRHLAHETLGEPGLASYRLAPHIDVQHPRCELRCHIDTERLGANPYYGGISMARIEEVSVTLVDDLDGSEAAETIKFSVDGKSYEIDLSKSNARRLRSALRPFTEHARSSRRTRAPGRRTTSNKKGQGRAKMTGAVDPAEVRAWAKVHRVKVAPRGRIAGDVLERWHAATKG